MSVLIEVENDFTFDKLALPEHLKYVNTTPSVVY